MSIDAKLFRQTLGRFATGVVIATTIGESGAPVGVTINSFTSVSLDPPLVLFCLISASDACGAFQKAGRFAANILSEEQKPLSARFARGDQAERWRDVDFERFDGEPNGLPVFPQSLALIDCVIENCSEAGDHLIFLGRVRTMTRRQNGRPLLYVDGRYASLADTPAS